jgi:hypothetical protein
MTSADGTAKYRAGRLWSHAVRLSIILASWLLLMAVVTQWVLIRLMGDVWWVGTIALFAPRWPLIVPLAVTTLLSAAWLRRSLWITSGSWLLLLGPVMGFCIPLSFAAEKPAKFRLRVITINAGNATAELMRRDFIHGAPDVIAFQEFDPLTPSELLDDRWHWQVAGGTAIASRYPIQEYRVFSAGRVGRWGDMALGARLNLPIGDIWVYTVHLNTPRWGLEGLAVTRRGIVGIDELRSNTRERGFESQTIRQWIPNSDLPSIVAGDFNMPVESWFYRRDWSGYQNAFSTAGWGLGHTKFTRRLGVRIDHILVNEHFRVASCHVSDTVGGDHAPVVADLALR